LAWHRKPPRLATRLAAALIAVPAAARAQEYGDHVTGGWGDVRRTLEEQGLAVEGTWTLELARVFEGGVRHRTTLHNLLDVNFTFDAEPLLSIPGATLYLDAYSLNGRVVSDDIGDFQFCSNIDAEPMHQIAELWWQQELFDGAVRLKLGKVDANTEFGFVDDAREFLHSGLAWPITSGMPLYPDPATSANLFVTPFDGVSIGIGCYDGAGQEGISTGGRGAKTFFGPPADLFFIGQLDLRWHARAGTLPGRLGLGSTLHTGTFDRFDGGREKGTRSFYATLDQQLWRERPDDAEDAQGIRLGAIAGRADDEVSEAARQVSVGLEWQGLQSERDDDVVGLAFSALEFADHAGFDDRREVAFEIVWKVQVTPWLVIRPDFQYVRNPSGDDDVDDAVVGFLRIDISL
jgi:porin